MLHDDRKTTVKELAKQAGAYAECIGFIGATVAAFLWLNDSTGLRNLNAPSEEIKNTQKASFPKEPAVVKAASQPTTQGSFEIDLRTSSFVASVPDARQTVIAITALGIALSAFATSLLPKSNDRRERV